MTDQDIVHPSGGEGEGGGGSKSHRKCCTCKSCVKFVWYNGSDRTTQAFYFNQFGRSMLFVSVTFLSLAILQLANKAAGCPIDEETGAYLDCGNRIYGAKPSSMLALMAVVGGVATAAFMPYAGAVVDYTDRRRGFGIAVASLLVIVNFIQVFIFDSTWFPFAILQAVIAASTFMANAMVMWSYVGAESEHKLHGVTASGRNWETGGMLSYLLVVAGVGFAFSWDSVTLARFAQALCSVVGGLFMYLSYSRYQPMKAQKTLQEGQNLYLAGMTSLWRTITDLGRTAPGAQRYLISIIFADAATGSFTSLAVTYLKEQLGMSDFSTQIFIILTLVCGVPGTLIHRTLGRSLGHKRSYLLALSYWIGITGAFVGILNGPDRQSIAFAFAALYGIGYGWLYPSTNGFFISLLPKGRDVELWGWNMFAGACLAWVPPLVFTALNESVGDMRAGMGGLMLFHAVGLGIAATIPTGREGLDDNDGGGMAEVEIGKASVSASGRAVSDSERGDPKREMLRVEQV